MTLNYPTLQDRGKSTPPSIFKSSDTITDLNLTKPSELIKILPLNTKGSNNNTILNLTHKYNENMTIIEASVKKIKSSSTFVKVDIEKIMLLASKIKLSIRKIRDQTIKLNPKYEPIEIDKLSWDKLEGEAKQLNDDLINARQNIIKKENEMTTFIEKITVSKKVHHQLIDYYNQSLRDLQETMLKPTSNFHEVKKDKFTVKDECKTFFDKPVIEEDSRQIYFKRAKELQKSNDLLLLEIKKLHSKLHFPKEKESSKGVSKHFGIFDKRTNSSSKFREKSVPQKKINTFMHNDMSLDRSKENSHNYQDMKLVDFKIMTKPKIPTLESKDKVLNPPEYKELALNVKCHKRDPSQTSYSCSRDESRIDFENALKNENTDLKSILNKLINKYNATIDKMMINSETKLSKVCKEDKKILCEIISEFEHSKKTMANMALGFIRIAKKDNTLIKNKLAEIDLTNKYDSRKNSLSSNQSQISHSFRKLGYQKVPSQHSLLTTDHFFKENRGQIIHNEKNTKVSERRPTSAIQDKQLRHEGLNYQKQSSSKKQVYIQNSQKGVKTTILNLQKSNNQKISTDKNSSFYSNIYSDQDNIIEKGKNILNIPPLELPKSTISNARSNAMNGVNIQTHESDLNLEQQANNINENNQKNDNAICLSSIPFVINAPKELQKCFSLISIFSSNMTNYFSFMEKDILNRSNKIEILVEFVRKINKKKQNLKPFSTYGSFKSEDKELLPKYSQGELELEVSNLKYTLSKKDEDVKNMVKENTKLKKMNIDLDKKINQLKDEKIKNVIDSKKNEKDDDKLKKQIKIYGNHLKKKENEILKLKEELEIKKKAENELNIKFNMLNSQFESERENLGKLHESYNLNIKEMSEENNILMEKIKETGNIIQLNSSDREEFEAIKKEIILYKITLERLVKRFINDYNKDNFLENISFLETNIDKIEMDNKNLSDQINSLKEGIEFEKLSSNDIKAHVDELEKQKDEIETEKRSLIQENLSKLTLYQENLKNRDIEIDSQNKLILTLRQNSDKMEKQYSNSIKELEVLHTSLNNIKSKMIILREISLKVKEIVESKTFQKIEMNELISYSNQFSSENSNLKELSDNEELEFSFIPEICLSIHNLMDYAGSIKKQLANFETQYNKMLPVHTEKEGYKTKIEEYKQEISYLKINASKELKLKEEANEKIKTISLQLKESKEKLDVLLLNENKLNDQNSNLKNDLDKCNIKMTFEISKMESVKKNLEDKIVEMQNKNEQLIKEYQEKIIQNEDQISTQTENLKQKHQELQEKASENIKLNNQINEFRIKFKEREEENNKLAINYKQLLISTNASSDLESQLNQSRINLEEKTNENNILTESIMSLNNIIKENEVSINELKNKLIECETERDSYLKGNELLRLQIVSLENENSKQKEDLRKKISEFEEEKIKINQMLLTLKQENENNLSQIKNKTEYINNVKKVNKFLISKVKNFSEKIKELDGKRVDLSKVFRKEEFKLREYIIEEIGQIQEISKNNENNYLHKLNKNKNAFASSLEYLNKEKNDLNEQIDFLQNHIKSMESNINLINFAVKNLIYSTSGSELNLTINTINDQAHNQVLQELIQSINNAIKNIFDHQSELYKSKMLDLENVNNLEIEKYKVDLSKISEEKQVLKDLIENIQNEKIKDTDNLEDLKKSILIRESQIEELKKEIRNLEAINLNYTNKLTEQEKLISELESKSSSLQSNLDDSLVKYQNLQNISEKLESQNTELNAKIEHLQTNYDKENKAKENLQLNYLNLENEKQVLTDEIQSITLDLNNTQNKVEELKKLNGIQVKNNIDLESKCIILSEQISEKQNTSNNLKEAYINLEKEKEELNNIYSQNKQNLVLNIEQISNLNKAIETKDTIIKDLGDEKELLVNQNQEFLNTMQGLKEEITKIQGESDQIKSTNEKLNENIFEKDTKIEDLNLKIKLLEEQANENNSKIGLISNEIAEMNSQNSELINQNKQLVQENNKHHNKEEESIILINSLKDQIQNLDNSTIQNYSEINTLKNENLKLSKMNEELNENNKSSLKENESLLENLKGQKQSIEQFEIKIQYLEQENNGYKNYLETIKNEKQNLGEVHQEIVKEKSRIEVENNMMKTIIDKTKEDTENMIKENNQIKEKIVNLNSEINALNENNEKQKSEIENLINEKNILEMKETENIKYINDLDSDFKNLKNELSIKSKLLDEKEILIKEGINNQAESSEEFNKQITILNNKIISIETENKELMNTINQKAMEEESIKLVNEKLTKKIEDNESEISNQKKTIVELEKDLASIKDISQNLSSTLENTKLNYANEEKIQKEKYNELLDQKEQESFNIVNLEKVNSDLKISVDKSNVAMSEMNDQINSYQREISEMQSSMNKKDIEFIQLKENYENHQNIYSKDNEEREQEIQNMIVDNNAKIEEKENCIKELKDKLHNISEQNTELSKNILSIRENYENSLKQLDDNIITLKENSSKMIFEKNSQIELLTNEIVQLNSKSKEEKNQLQLYSEKQIAEQELIIKGLEKENNELVKKYEEEVSNFTEQKTTIMNQNSELVENKDKELKALNEQLTEINETHKILNSKIDQILKEKDEINSKLIQEERNASENAVTKQQCIGKLGDQEKEINDLTNSNSILKAELQNLNEKEKEIEKELVDFKEINNKLIFQINDLSSEISRLKDESLLLSQKNQSFLNEIALHKEEIKEKQIKFENSNCEVQDLMDKLSKSMSEIGKKETEINELKNKNQEINQILSVQEKTNESLNNEISNFKLEKSDLVNQIQKFDEINQNLLVYKETNNELIGKIENYLKDINKLNDENQELKNQLKDFVDKNQILNNELEDLKGTNSNLEQKMLSKEEGFNKLDVELKSFIKENSELKEINEMLALQKNQFEAIISNLTEELNKKEQIKSNSSLLEICKNEFSISIFHNENIIESDNLHKDNGVEIEVLKEFSNPENSSENQTDLFYLKKLVNSLNILVPAEVIHPDDYIEMLLKLFNDLSRELLEREENNEGLQKDFNQIKEALELLIKEKEDKPKLLSINDSEITINFTCNNSITTSFDPKRVSSIKNGDLQILIEENTILVEKINSLEQENNILQENYNFILTQPIQQRNSVIDFAKIDYNTCNVLRRVDIKELTWFLIEMKSKYYWILKTLIPEQDLQNIMEKYISSEKLVLSENSSLILNPEISINQDQSKEEIVESIKKFITIRDLESQTIIKELMEEINTLKHKSEMTELESQKNENGLINKNRINSDLLENSEVQNINSDSSKFIPNNQNINTSEGMNYIEGLKERFTEAETLLGLKEEECQILTNDLKKLEEELSLLKSSEIQLGIPEMMKKSIIELIKLIPILDNEAEKLISQIFSFLNITENENTDINEIRKNIH